MSDIELWQCEFASQQLGNRRAVWLQPSPERAQLTCIFLDAEYYLTHLNAARTLVDLQSSGVLPTVTAAYVSAIDPKTRWVESFCNDDFAAFLGEELAPWIRQRANTDPDGITILVGLSLTGLSAAHAALRYPEVFPRVVCQSGSFWWNDNWLTSHVPSSSNPIRMRVSVGAQETEENVDHGDGLIQVTSQVESNRMARDAFAAAGHSVSYEEHPGGHDLASFAADLAPSLTSILDS